MTTIVIIIIIIINVKILSLAPRLPLQQLSCFPALFHNKNLVKNHICSLLSTFPFHPLTFVHSNQVLFPLCYWNCFCQGHLWTLSCQKQWLKFLSFHFSSVYHSGHILSPEAFSSLGFWEAAHLAFPLPFSTPFLSVFAGSSFFFLISPFCTHWVFSFSPQLGKALIHYWFWNICLQSQTLPSGPFL